MKKKTFSFVMLSILLAQNFGFAVNAYAVTTTEAQTETTDTAKKEAELSNSTPSLPLATTTTSEMNQPTATTESQTTEASTTASSDALLHHLNNKQRRTRTPHLMKKPYQMFKRQLQMNYLTV
ncbi:hypothetical protein ACHLPL_04370 [Enterococcus faecalis]